MTTSKILLLSTAAVIGIGGTSAALTKDQWWPKGETINKGESGSRSEEEDADEVDTAKNCSKEQGQKCQEEASVIQTPVISTALET